MTVEPSDPAAAIWERLRGVGMVRRVEAEHTLFSAGDAADGAYVVLSGRFAVVENHERVAVLGPGDLFGEIGALGTGVRSATVHSLDDGELLFLSPDQLRDGLVTAPDLFWHALRLVVARLREVALRQVGYRDEHKALREVQRSLLPDLGQLDSGGAFEVDAVWQPCTYASGDYYDVVPIDADRHLLVIGDVMGHGAESSLMMAIARAQLRELARGFRRTDEVLLNLDGYLRDNAPPRQGMSLFVASYDRRSRVLEYSSAGHPFPLLLREGRVSDLRGSPGIILAVPFLLGTGYERHETELDPGDRVLFFTDGLYEVSTPGTSEQLGRAGLSELLVASVESGAARPVDELVRRVAQLDVNAAADDDRTALLLTIR